jgi:hypothetical protein
MRLRGLDRCLVFGFLLALFYFGAVERSAGTVVCDNKCRERNFWWKDGGLTCGWVLKQDCLLCICSTCGCSPRQGDNKTAKTCTLVGVGKNTGVFGS